MHNFSFAATEGEATAKTDVDINGAVRNPIDKHGWSVAEYYFPTLHNLVCQMDDCPLYKRKEFSQEKRASRPSSC